MHNDMDHTTPTKDELKLIIDNSLLEQEKRITKSINDTLADQNKTYMDHIVSLTSRLSAVETNQKLYDQRLKGAKGTTATIAAAFGVFTGFVGFLIAQITK